MKKALVVVVALAAALALVLGAAGCGGEVGEANANPTTTLAAAASGNDSGAVHDQGQAAISVSGALKVTYDDEDLDDTWDTSTASFITLADGSVRLDGTGGTASGDKVTITSAGTYVVSGTLSDGQIVVDLDGDGTVKLVLNGADITCSSSSPIYIKNADKTIITLADGTQNLVTDGASYVLEDSDSGEPDAAIFSKDDLTINGAGTLTVKANCKNGIASKDDLKIVSGSITVDAVNDALKGKDCIGVKDGTITLTAGGDGLQSTNDVDTEKGYIDIQGGTLKITAENDGIQAQATLLVGAGDITLSTGGGSANAETHVGSGADGFGGQGQGQRPGGGRWSSSTTASSTTTTTDDTADSTSAKGLKATAGVFVEGGTVTIDSADDAVHSNNAVQIDGGTLTLASGDDGVHADATLNINGGDITITASYEGIESAVITINDGTVHIQSSDDGINVAGGNDDSATNGPMGQDMFTVNENNQFHINGGYIAVDARGDGIDCNGRIFMTAGTVILNGPTESMNGAIDYMGEFTVSGGYIVAAGSSGMAEAPSESSTQYSIMVNLDTVQAAGTLVHIEDEDGADVLTFAPTKQYQSVVLCSPDLHEGAIYTVYLGGSSTGTVIDSLCSGDAYTPGTEYVTLTISGIVTTSGAMGGMMPGGTQGGWQGGRGALPGGTGGASPGDTTATS